MVEKARGVGGDEIDSIYNLFIVSTLPPPPLQTHAQTDYSPFVRFFSPKEAAVVYYMPGFKVLKKKKNLLLHLLHFSKSSLVFATKTFARLEREKGLAIWVQATLINLISKLPDLMEGAAGPENIQILK